MSDRMCDRHRHRSAAPFPGFRRPTYTQVPDEFFDLAPELLERHLKIMLYVTRRTLGFKKPTDRISISQFLDGITTRDGRRLDRGCGLSKKPLLEGLKELEAAGLLAVARSTNRRDGHEVNEYELHLRPEEPASAAGLRDFGGFREQVKYVQVPDELFDVLLPDLNAGELKLLLFIVRQTQGFGRESVALGRRQILDGIHAEDGRLQAHGAGLGERHLKEAKKRLRSHNVIETQERRAADGRGEATIYRLKVLPPAEGGAQSPPGGVQESPQGEGAYSPKRGVVSLPRRGALSPPRQGGDGGPGHGAQTPPNNKHGARTVNQETKQQQTDIVVVALTALGVTQKTARDLAARFPAENILIQIEMLPRRRPENPPGMLVRAIEEDWASPPERGEEDPEQEQESVGPPEPAPQESAAAWRERTLAAHGATLAEQEDWAEVCVWVPRLSGHRCPQWLLEAVMVRGSGRSMDVLLPNMMCKLTAERQYVAAVRDALRTVLRSELEPSFRVSL